jgi:hypothetical protein
MVKIMFIIKYKQKKSEFFNRADLLTEIMLEGCKGDVREALSNVLEHRSASVSFY